MTPRGFLVSSGITYAGSAVSILLQAAFYAASLGIGVAAFGSLQSTMSVLFVLGACRGIAGTYVVIHTGGDQRLLRGVTRTALRFGALVGVALGAGFLTLAPFLRDFLRMDTTLPFFMVAIVAVPSVLSGIGDGILNVQRRFTALSVSAALAPATNVALSLVLFRDGFQESDAAIIILVGQLASCANVFLVDHASLRSGPAHADGTSLREIGSLLLASVLFGGSLRLDLFWARHALPDASAGTYAVAASIALVLYLVTSGIARVTSVSLRDSHTLRLLAASYAIMATT